MTQVRYKDIHNPIKSEIVRPRLLKADINWQARLAVRSKMTQLGPGARAEARLQWLRENCGTLGCTGCHIDEATMFTKEQQKRTNYTVKNVETVVAGKDVQARLFTLAPGEVIPWHSHSEIADHFFVLDGELTVETRAPDDYRTLAIGERYQINAGHAHQTSNRGTRDCRFLIVQGVGRYDFLRSPL